MRLIRVQGRCHKRVTFSDQTFDKSAEVSNKLTVTTSFTGPLEVSAKMADHQAVQRQLREFVMIKLCVLNLVLLFTLNAFAESPCDIRPGTSIGIRVVEFASGHQIHSKMPLRESTAEALLEEMINLQDMGICEEKILAKKCVLKFEKHKQTNYVTLYRGHNRWNTWGLKSKDQAQNYVKSLKKVGFCS